MVIEYLISGDNYKSKLPDEGMLAERANISKRSFSLGNNVFLLRMKITNNDIESAKILSDYNEKVLDVLKANSYRFSLLINESSQFFERMLYPLVAEYEIKLRKLIKVALFSIDGKAREKINKKIKDNKEVKKNTNKDDTNENYSIDSFLEQADLGSVFDFLFLNDELIGHINENKKTFTSRTALIEYITKYDKNSIWEDFFSEVFKGSIIPDIFGDIKKFRNDVMHFHTMNYEQYISSEKQLKNAIIDIDKQINKKIVIDDNSHNLDKITCNSAYLRTISQWATGITVNLPILTPSFNFDFNSMIGNGTLKPLAEYEKVYSDLLLKVQSALQPLSQIRDLLSKKNAENIDSELNNVPSKIK